MLLLEQTTAAAEAEEDTAAASEWTIMRASRPTEGRAGIAALLGPVRAQLFFTLLALLPWLCAVRERAAAASEPQALEFQTFQVAGIGMGGLGAGELGAGGPHAAEEAALAAEAVRHRPQVPVDCREQCLTWQKPVVKLLCNNIVGHSSQIQLSQGRTRLCA